VTELRGGESSGAIATIVHGGRTYRIEYRPAAGRGPDFAAIVKEMQAADDPTARFAAHRKALLALVEQWDALDGSQRPVALDERSLLHLVPPSLVEAVVQGVLDHVKAQAAAEKAAKAEGRSEAQSVLRAAGVARYFDDTYGPRPTPYVPAGAA